MEITNVSLLAGGYTAPTAGVAVPADSRAILSDIAASTSLSDAERGSLVQAVAAADSGLSAADRTQVLETIQRLGIYLRNTSNEGFPRWPMMTALRAYGMNLSGNTAGASTSATVAAQQAQVAVQKSLQQAVASRNVSVQTAVAQTFTPTTYHAPTVKAPVAAKSSGSSGSDVPHVETVA